MNKPALYVHPVPSCPAPASLLTAHYRTFFISAIVTWELTLVVLSIQLLSQFLLEFFASTLLPVDSTPNSVITIDDHESSSAPLQTTWYPPEITKGYSLVGNNLVIPLGTTLVTWPSGKVKC